MRLFPDLTNQIGQGYFRERSLEAVLTLRKNPRHAFLEVSGQLPPQGMHVGGSFSRSVQLREIARENNPGQSGWSDPGKGALTFLILIVQIKRTIHQEN